MLLLQRRRLAELYNPREGNRPPPHLIKRPSYVTRQGNTERNPRIVAAWYYVLLHKIFNCWYDANISLVPGCLLSAVLAEPHIRGLNYSFAFLKERDIIMSSDAWRVAVNLERNVYKDRFQQYGQTYVWLMNERQNLHPDGIVGEDYKILVVQ